MANVIKQHLIQRDQRYEEVKDFMREKIETEGIKESFYMYDIKCVSERIKLWRKLMPRVEIFYAAKCNSDEKIGRECVERNTGFDVASATEIE